jgi:hypothetical protein
LKAGYGKKKLNPTTEINSLDHFLSRSYGSKHKLGRSSQHHGSISSLQLRVLMGEVYRSKKNIPYNTKVVSNYTSSLDGSDRVKDIPELDLTPLTLLITGPIYSSYLVPWTLFFPLIIAATWDSSVEIKSSVHVHLDLFMFFLSSIFTRWNS